MDGASATPIAGKGVFIVVDYPEATRQQVRTLLRDLARVESSPGPIRVLLLSRLPLKEWYSLIDAADAASICDAQELRIGPLPVKAAIELFRAAALRFAGHMGQMAPEVDDDELTNWLVDSEIHSLAVFIVAAALHCVITQTSDVSLTGSQIVTALVRREVKRLDSVGREAHWGEHAASRIVGLAAVSNGLDAAAIRRLAADREFGIPFDQPVEAVKNIGFWQGKRVPPPTPDIVAAEFLYEVLKASYEGAPEWLWASLGDSAPNNVDGLGRIAYDIARLHGPEALVRFADWLAASIGGKAERAIQWRAIFERETPIGVARLAVAIGKTILASSDLDCRELRPDPLGLMCLRFHRKAEEGVETSREAADIWRRLALTSPDLYEPDMARSFLVLSDCLSDDGKQDQALEQIREAVDIWRRLAASDTKLYEPEFAKTLNALSVNVWHTGDKDASTKAIRECVAIWKRLVNEVPGRYEPDLALGLNNLSRNLADDTENLADGLRAIRDAIRIYGIVVAANPARYGMRLAQSLEKLHLDLRRTGDVKASITALREAVEIKKKLAASNPFQFGPGAAESLGRLSLELSSAKDEVDASSLLDVIEIAAKTVCILLVRGDNPSGEPIFAYVAVRADRLEDFMDAQKAGMFYPEDYGVIVESGLGESSVESRKKMEVEYGFNHEAMIDIPDVKKASEIKRDLRGEL